MPSTTLRELPPAEPVQMRAILHRAWYGALLAFPPCLLSPAKRCTILPDSAGRGCPWQGAMGRSPVLAARLCSRRRRPRGGGCGG